MSTLTGQFTASRAASDPTSSAVVFGADIAHQPVFLSAAVIPSRAFARLMLTLGRVVRLQAGAPERDHSAYQQWVRGEYLKELPAEQADAAQQLRELAAVRNEQWQAVLDAKERARRLTPETDVFWRERRAFWQWLYTHNREAWYVLDPIVSVQPDAVFFEAFSQDESVYARVRLPQEALDHDRPMQPGTTNIDYSVPLEREFARARSYRPLHLTVGAQAVGIATSTSSVTERKIDLPDTWVRGLVEVQSALALAPIAMTLSSGFVADIIARLESERERTGPRALVFKLTPDEPIDVEIQPWGEVLTDHGTRYQGDRRREIKVWGRRRLQVLADLLPHAAAVTVHLVDDGMPSFWSVNVDGVTLTIGLSGWTSQDWAGRARFSAMIPSSTASEASITEAANLLRSHITLTADDLVTRMNLTPADARAVLQRLCLLGQAMYDVDLGRYRWRALFPQLDLASRQDIGLEERKGVELARTQATRITSDIHGPDGVRRLVAAIPDQDREHEVIIETDVDARVIYAQCDCSHFRYHKLRQGPCRHIVAATLAEGRP